MITGARLLARTFRAAGVDAIFGHPVPGLEVVRARRSVAPVLARAHERVHGSRAAVSIGRGRFLVGWQAGGLKWQPLPVSSAEMLVHAVPRLAGLRVGLKVEIDLDAPVEDVDIPNAPWTGSWFNARPEVREAIAGAEAPVVLAGPDVVRRGGVRGFQALAVAGSFGTLNTWGAKGILHWESRHHWATIGLQEQDFALGGLGETDLIIATGLDSSESPPALWQRAPSVTVEPLALAPLAESLDRPRRELAFPPLRERLGAVTQAGWARTGAPLAPSRATRDYSEAIGRGGLLAADPGTAGYWVARTYSTTELGSVLVPAEPTADGFAAACVLVARLRNPARPALAVVDGPLSDLTIEVLHTARRLRVAVPVEAWGPDGDRLDAEQHTERVRRLAYGDEPAVASLAVDDSQLADMLDAAGPIIAWAGRAVG